MSLCKNKIRILTALPARWTTLKNVTNIYNNALRKHLKGLESVGLIVKKDGVWERTPEGDRLLQEVIAGEASTIGLSFKFKPGRLRDEVFQRFKHVGFAATLQKSRGFFEAVAIIPVVKDLILTFHPGRLEDEYLSFATDLYMDSVISFLGLKPEQLDYIKLRAAWQVVDLNGWRKRLEKPGLVFDYPRMWNSLYPDLSDKLKKRLEELDGNEKNQQWRMFRRLKLWSFTVTERLRLLEKIPLQPTH